MTVATTEVDTPTFFDTSMRCDRCGAQAHVMAVLQNGTLLFCKHHGNEYRAGLEAAGAAIEEEDVCG